MSLPATLSLLLGGALVSRADSTTGTEFWTTCLENYFRSYRFAIVVGNASATTASVRVEGRGRNLGSASIPPDSVHVFAFDSEPRMMQGTEVAPHAYRVTSDVPVTVHQLNPLEGATTNDASTVLPVEELGTRYRILSWEHEDLSGVDMPSSFAVVPVTQEPTTITITPTAAVRAGGPVAATPAGTPFSVTLSRFDVLHVVTDRPGDDFTGTLVVADRPVAVFGSHVCAQVPFGVEFCDHLEEQLYPVANWGVELAAAKSRPRFTENDWWRVVAGHDGTLVTLDPDVLGTGPVPLDAGEDLSFQTASDVMVTASRPVQVGQYLVGSRASGSFWERKGDPSQILVLPTAQYDRDFLFLVPEICDEDWLTIVAPAGAAVLLDGATVDPASFSPIGAGAWTRAHVAVADGVHRIASDVPVAVSVYGYDVDTSYGFYAGGRSEDINTALACSAFARTPSPCDYGRVWLDGSGTTGPPPLRYLWSSVTSDMTFLSPTSAVTQVEGAGVAALTVSSGDDSVTCFVNVPQPAPLPELPTISCPATVTADAQSREGAVVVVQAAITSPCPPPPPIENDRTSGGADATDLYPCGITRVVFRATDPAGRTATCASRVIVNGPPDPGGVSDPPWGVPLLVTKPAGDSGPVRLAWEDLSNPDALYNAYRGTLARDGIVAYDHAPLACALGGSPLPPALWHDVPRDAGSSHYFLVTASVCGTEGPFGRRSDGTLRPVRPSDCGGL